MRAAGRCVDDGSRNIRRVEASCLNDGDGTDCACGPESGIGDVHRNNPRSERRTGLIEEAKRLFLRDRPPETPVIVASNLGRPGEKVEVTTLWSFDPTSVDMLTIVLIGASTSRVIARGSGKSFAYTPRGYAAKAEP